MIDAADRQGLGLAIAGHFVLFALLTVGLMLRISNKLPLRETMDVQFVGPVGLQSAAPSPAAEAPAESQAPEQGEPEEPVVPQPQPEPRPAPEPAPPKPQPKPSERPAPQPKPQPQPVKRERLTDDLLKDVRVSAAKEQKPKGQRLGSDFLKGITGEKTAGKGQAPRAAVTGPQMAGLAAAIAAQVKLCYIFPAGGAGSDRITSTIHLRFNRDGSVIGTPEIVEHAGVTQENQPYVRQMDDAAKRAVLRCAPLRLPANLYEGGWQDITFDFTPQVMR